MPINYGLFKSVFKKSIIDSIYNEIISKSARYYHFLGKENVWTDFLSPFIQSSTSDVPGPPSDNFRYELHVRRDILATKLITASDVSYIVPRIDWVSGTVYDMYDDALSPDDPAPSGAVRLEDARFYVLTTDYNVYKCIFNANNGPSLNQPVGTGASTFATGDGYLWKFMYTIPISLRNRFLTSEFIPVTTALKNQFYVDGEIVQVIIDNPGSGYVNPSVTVSGNGYIKNNPFLLKGIVISDAGEGYTVTPSITFANPTVISGDEEVATGEVTISGGSINIATLLTAGYGYTSDPVKPVITVDPPIPGALAWLGNSGYTLNSYIEYNGNFYQVTTSGIVSSNPPTHTSGSVVNGGATLLYVARQAVLTVDDEQTSAILDVVLDSNGSITNVIIEDGGIGYDNVNIEITELSTHPITDPKDKDETYAVLTANLNTGNINTLQADVEIQAVPGTIEAMKVVNGGSGYGAALVEILGDGQGATATAQVSGGKVVGITMTNVGSGYTWTDVVIIGNEGASGAIVRAIMSPLKGHGNNAIDELNANSIMFYSSIGRDINQGLTINNDYRKAGLLKNITEFNSNNKFTKDTGSGCVLLTGNFDKTKLAYDQLLVLANATYKKFRIVEFTDTQILLSVFNNFTINIGDTLLTTTKVVNPDGSVTEPTNGYTIEVTAVSEREIDQFSGDFLFLTVREPFAPSEEQIITVRTVLTI